MSKETVVTCVSLMSKFYVMVNGHKSFGAFFRIRSLFEVSSAAFCNKDVISGLERTQLKMIFVLNFLTNEVYSDRAKDLNVMVKKWRQTQIRHLAEKCGSASNDNGEESLLTKFIATEC